MRKINENIECMMERREREVKKNEAIIGSRDPNNIRDKKCELGVTEMLKWTGRNEQSDSMIGKERMRRVEIYRD